MERGLTCEVMTLDQNIQYSNNLFVTYTGENKIDRDLFSMNTGKYKFQKYIQFAATGVNE